MKAPNGIGFAASLASSLAFWTTGGWWDLSKIVGADDTLINTPIASAVGANTLTPGVRYPILRNNAVRGVPAVYFEQIPNNGYNTLTVNALASTFRSATGNWTILLKVRPDKGNANICVFGVGRSDGSATESLSLRQNIGTWTLRKTSGAGTTNLAAAASTDPYSDTYLAVTCTAGAIAFYVRASGKATEVITSPGSLEATNLSASCDRLTVMGLTTNTAQEGFSGYLGGVAIGLGALTAAQVHNAINQLAAGDYYGPQVSAVGAALTGSSLTLAVTDTVTSAGMRDTFAELCVSEALEYYSYGDTLSGGPGQQKYKNSFTSSAGSQGDASILGMLLNAIAGSPVPIRYWYAELGTMANNLVTAPATIAATVVATATTAMNALLAQDPRAFMTIPSITPVSTTISGGAVAANADACHAIWQTQVVAPLQAAFPGRVFYFDAYLAFGGVWSAGLFADATGHPNRAGYIQESLHPQYGYLRATNELGENIVTRLRNEAKKPAKKRPLTVRIDSPIIDGSPIAPGNVTFVAGTSRVGATCVLKRDGVTVATMSALELYDPFLAFSDYSKKQHYQTTLVYNGSADTGNHVFTVVATDVADGTVVTSDPVTINFAVVATPLTAVTSVPCRAWYRADLGVTVSSGVATAMLDQSGSGNNLAFTVNGPTVVLDTLSLGHKRTLQVNAQTSLFKSPVVAGVPPPFAVYYVCRPDDWVNGFPMINAGQAADIGGAPNVSQFNGAYVNPTQETVGQWAVYRLHFTNTAADSIKIGARAVVTGGTAGNQTVNQINLGLIGGRQFGFRQCVIYGGIPTAPEEAALVALLVADGGGVPAS